MNISVKSEINIYKKLKFFDHNHSMMTEDRKYYYNPYLPEDRVGKGEKMSLIRATLLLCITALLCVGTITFGNYKKDRFEIIPVNNGVFIFDRQTTASNFCTNSKCIVLSSEFLIPQKVLVAEIPGVITKTQIQNQNPAAQGNNNLSQQSLVTPSFNRANMEGQNHNNSLGQNFDPQQQNMVPDQNNFNDNNEQNNINGFQNDENDNGQNLGNNNFQN